jgi:hypothetical protein
MKWFTNLSHSFNFARDINENYNLYIQVQLRIFSDSSCFSLNQTWFSRTQNESHSKQQEIQQEIQTLQIKICNNQRSFDFTEKWYMY